MEVCSLWVTYIASGRNHHAQVQDSVILLVHGYTPDDFCQEVIFNCGDTKTVGP